jgi:hypothetical protein
LPRPKPRVVDSPALLRNGASWRRSDEDPQQRKVDRIARGRVSSSARCSKDRSWGHVEDLWVSRTCRWESAAGQSHPTYPVADGYDEAIASSSSTQERATTETLSPGTLAWYWSGFRRDVGGLPRLGVFGCTARR